jgi:hypothetical protein
MRRVSRVLIVTAALCFLVHGAVSAIGGAMAQRQRRRTPRPVVTPAIDYSKFLHSTKKHQADCVTCHKIPTSNWQRVREYPDVADYPDHDACVSCHRPQFFKGAKPAICSICHTKVSPRDDERFAFRNPASRRQFQIEFPHDKHQDVIAQLFRRFSTEEQPRLVKISHRPSNFIAQDRQQYNNCEICHREVSKPLLAPAGGWVDGVIPAAGALKSEPHNHSYCFSCHWKSEPPVNTQCGDCHKLTNPYEAVGPTRISMKFDHNGGGAKNEHLDECTMCHINITKSAHIKRSEIDVPVLTCKRCHAQDSGSAPPKVDCRQLGGSRVIGDELNCLQADKQYTCSYCHTSNFGRLDPPSSHFTVANKNRFMRKDLK